LSETSHAYNHTTGRSVFFNTATVSFKLIVQSSLRTNGNTTSLLVLIAKLMLSGQSLTSYVHSEFLIEHFHSIVYQLTSQEKVQFVTINLFANQSISAKRFHS
jgi:hypothetical protein